jgi:hypothetical protein
MEESIGKELVKIGARVTDSNLKKETMGKVEILMEDGKAKYPSVGGIRHGLGEGSQNL